MNVPDHGTPAVGLSALGTERLGIWVIRHPAIAAVVLLAMSFAAVAAAVAWLRFDGDITRVLASRAAPYAAFTRLERQFHPFSHDEVLLVRAPSLATAAGFELLRELHLELQLAAPVKKVISVFSLAERDAATARWRPALPSVVESDADLERHLHRLRAGNAAAASLFSREHAAAVLIVMPKGASKSAAAKQGETGGAASKAGFAAVELRQLDDILAHYRAEGFSISAVGKPAVQREILAAIEQDQIVLAILGILICAAVALATFRTLAAAAVCILPTLAALAWYLGFIAAVGADIDLLTTVIPVLIIVLSFADTLHLFYHWRRACDAGFDPVAALETATRIVAPACAIAALTTAVAFLALIVATSDALDRMALSGIVGVAIVYLSVLTVAPLAALALHRRGARFKPVDVRFLQLGSGLGQRLLGSSRGAVIAVALALTGALLIAHFTVPVRFSLVDYLPRQSELRDANDEVDRIFNGAGQIFATIRRSDAGAVVGADEIARLRTVEEVFRGVFGPASTVSLATARGSTGAADRPIDLAALPASAEPFLTRFISRDRDRLLISVFVSQQMTADALNARLATVRTALAKRLPDADIEISGGPALRAALVPRIVFDLRHGLVLSAVVSIFIIALALRSWRLGLAALLPNALPVLAAEAGVWAVRGGIETSTVIALTIGFGLAVDDTVHLLNHYVIARAAARTSGPLDPVQAMRTALAAVSPALVATTVVLAAALMVTGLSALAVVLSFGCVVITVLVFALAADILVLPSMAVELERRTNRGPLP